VNARDGPISNIHAKFGEAETCCFCLSVCMFVHSHIWKFARFANGHTYRQKYIFISYHNIFTPLGGEVVNRDVGKSVHVIFVVGLFTAHQSGSVSISQQCSPRWIVHRKQAAHGAHLTAARTLERCLRACENVHNCMAAEWSVIGCYLYHTSAYSRRKPSDFATQFELVRSCETSGMIMPIRRPGLTKMQ